MVIRIINRIGYYLFRKPIYYVLSFLGNIQMPKASSEEIDIIIPVIAKDLITLPLCLNGIRKNICHNIKDIYLVGPEDDRLIKFAKNEGLKFVNELDVLGFSPKEVSFVTQDGRDRSGWLYQQLLKLSGGIGKCQNFVTIDSDHVLVRPHVFITDDGKYVFYRSSEFNWVYIIENYRLLGKFRLPILSYVAHKMVFNKGLLDNLKEVLERNSGLKWTDAIIQSLDNRYASPFSEFELYACFVDNRKKYNKLWFQKALPRNNSIDIDNIFYNYRKLLSITYPEYLRK